MPGFDDTDASAAHRFTETVDDAEHRPRSAARAAAIVTATTHGLRPWRFRPDGPSATMASMPPGLPALVQRSGYRLALVGLRAWWVIRRPRSDGVRCVLRHGDAFVLVRHSYGDARWMLPGGRLRRREHPIQTAAREMRQELALVGTSWQVLEYLAPRSGYRRRSRAESLRRHGTYYLRADVAEPRLTPRAAELRDAGWFTREQLPPDCSDALDIAIANGWLD